MSKNNEAKDKALFDRIASKYARKDAVESSRIARAFQLHCLTRLMVERVPHFGRVLEIGCGVGASAEYMEGLYDQYLGVDYSENLIQLARKRYAGKGVEFASKNIKDLDASERFDMILGVGVLHHVDNCEDVLHGLKRFAKKETLIGFVEPQRGNPFVQGLRAIRKITDKQYSDDQHFFSRAELIAVFEKTGYSVESIQYQGYLSPPLAQVVMNPQWLFKPLARAFTAIDGFVQKYFENRLAWNLVVVAKIKSADEEIS